MPIVETRDLRAQLRPDSSAQNESRRLFTLIISRLILFIVVTVFWSRFHLVYTRAWAWVRQQRCLCLCFGSCTGKESITIRPREEIKRLVNFHQFGHPFQLEQFTASCEWNPQNQHEKNSRDKRATFGTRFIFCCETTFRRKSSSSCLSFFVEMKISFPLKCYDSISFVTKKRF